MPSHKHKKRKRSHKKSKTQDMSSSDKSPSQSDTDVTGLKNGEISISLKPSHKHKKRKRSHKNYKEEDVSSSEDDEGFWNVHLSDSDNDRSNNGKRLTSLVRRSYMNHLKEVLYENFMMAMGTNELCNDSVQELTSKLTAALEKKALRASMVSELYRRSMFLSIKSIKSRTNLRSVYVDEQIFSKLNLSLNKETQTEDLGNRCEVEIQTDNPESIKVCTASTQTDPIPLAPIPSSQPYDPYINFSDSCHSSPGVSSTQPNPKTNGILDICNITSTSDLIPLLSGDTPAAAQSNLTTAKGLEATSDILQSFGTTENNNQRADLNTRLTAMGLLGDKGNESESKSKKSNWYAEEIAQSCNFTRIMMRMTERQQQRILSKIKKLFGVEDEILTELSEENIGICRRRIASVVVAELTPIYQARKIASRYLFKLVAKKITKSLMDESYAPDSRSIRKRVTDLFRNGHVIMSEADCV